MELYFDGKARYDFTASMSTSSRVTCRSLWKQAKVAAERRPLLSDLIVIFGKVYSHRPAFVFMFLQRKLSRIVNFDC